MKGSLLLACGLCLLFVNAAQSQTYTYLIEENPLFSMSVPDGWEVVTKPTKKHPDIRRVTATAPEGTIWMGAWLIKDATTIDQAVATLTTASRDLLQDLKNLKEPWNGQVNGMNARHFSLTGTQTLPDGKREKFEARALLFEPSSGRVAIAFCMTDQDGLTKQKAQIDAIFKSLRPGTK